METTNAAAMYRKQLARLIRKYGTHDGEAVFAGHYGAPGLAALNLR